MKLNKANARAYFKHYPGSKSVVIFIHGIIEGPKQFRNLAKIAYNKGRSINMLLLPGHGGSGGCFANTGYMAWVKYVTNEINRMRLYYDEIILVGHSMGALFAVCEAVSHKAQINRLVLFDIPLKIHVWPRVMEGALKILIGKVKPAEDYVVAEYNAMNVMPFERLSIHYISWARRYLELYTIIKYTRKQLKKLEVPIFIVFAEKDEFVSLKSDQYLQYLSAPYFKLKLKESGHFCYNHSDLIILEKYFEEFISNS